MQNTARLNVSAENLQTWLKRHLGREWREAQAIGQELAATDAPAREQYPGEQITLILEFSEGGEVEWTADPFPIVGKLTVFALGPERSKLEVWTAEDDTLPIWLSFLAGLGKDYPGTEWEHPERMGLGGEGPEGEREAEAREQAQATEEAALSGIRQPRDREMVRMWRAGYSGEQIAERLKMKTAHSALNRISALRGVYGEAVVPKRRNEWKEES